LPTKAGLFERDADRCVRQRMLTGEHRPGRNAQLAVLVEEHHAAVGEEGDDRQPPDAIPVDRVERRGEVTGQVIEP
jgi:hypothetical protein